MNKAEDDKHKCLLLLLNNDTKEKVTLVGSILIFSLSFISGVALINNLDPSAISPPKRNKQDSRQRGWRRQVKTLLIID